MKKGLILTLLALVMGACSQYTSTGPKLPNKVETGDKRLTITKDFIYVETCLSHTSAGSPIWKLEQSIPNDTTQMKILSQQ